VRGGLGIEVFAMRRIGEKAVQGDVSSSLPSVMGSNLKRQLKTGVCSALQVAGYIVFPPDFMWNTQPRQEALRGLCAPRGFSQRWYVGASQHSIAALRAEAATLKETPWIGGYGAYLACHGGVCV
jgi:hypothetical protein